MLAHKYREHAFIDNYSNAILSTYKTNKRRNKMRWKKILLIQVAGILVWILEVYFKIYPVTQLLGFPIRYEIDERIVLVTLGILPTFYFLFKLKYGHWLPISIAFVLSLLLYISYNH